MSGVLLSLALLAAAQTASAFIYVEVYEPDAVNYQMPRVAPHTPNLRVRALDQNGAVLTNVRFDWMTNGFRSSFRPDRLDTDQVADFTYSSPGDYNVVVRATRRDTGETDYGEFSFKVISAGDTPQPVTVQSPGTVDGQTQICVMSVKANKTLEWAYPGDGIQHTAVPVSTQPACFRIPVGTPGLVELYGKAWTSSPNLADTSPPRMVYYTGAPIFGDFRASLSVTRRKLGRNRIEGVAMYTGGEPHRFYARIRLQYRLRGKLRTIGVRPMAITVSGSFSEPFAVQRITRSVNLCSRRYQQLRRKGVRGGRYVFDYSVEKGKSTLSRRAAKKRFRIPRCGRRS